MCTLKIKVQTNYHLMKCLGGAQLTVPKNKRCLQWLKAKEQHESFRNRNLKIEQ